MIFDNRNTEILNPAGLTDSYLAPVTFSFRWDSPSFAMEDGGPVELSGADGAKAWLEQCIRTRRGAYGVYPADYGCSALDLVGRKPHSGAALPELERELQEAAAAYCEEIVSIGNVRYTDTGGISCDVTIEAERGLVQEVVEVD